MKLFISHSSKDIKMVKALVDLLYGMGLTDEEMFCSSIPGLGIPIKENIYDYLRNELNQEEIYTLFLLSDNYYKSPACLNEMGAVWIKQQEYLSFLLPDFTYREIKGAVNPDKISIRLDDGKTILRSRLRELKDDLKRKFSLRINDDHWEEIREKFMQSIASSSKIDLSFSRAFCIGEYMHEGCVIEESSLSDNQVRVTVNFDKTKADLCSLVINPMKNDWSRWVDEDQCLCFDTKSENGISKVVLELQIPSAEQNFQRTIVMNQRNRLQLKEICRQPEKWTYVKEVNFLFCRNDVAGECRFTITNLHIE